MSAPFPPAIARFRQAVTEAYGPRIERIVLYGSRARGDAHSESDWDVAVFLHELSPRTDALFRLSDMSTAVLMDTGEVISAHPFPAGSWKDRTLFMFGLRQDGIDL